MPTKVRHFIRLVALVVLLSFCTEQIGAAQLITGQSPKIAMSRDRTVSQASVSVQELLADPAKLVIPFANVQLKEIHNAHGNNLIIHIQDAHSNYSGQKHLAEALDSMMTRHAIPLVLAEGSFGDATLTELKQIASAGTWKKAAKRFLYDGILSGEEYLNVTTDHPMKIMGVENQDLYEANLRAYARLIGQRQEAMGYIRRIRIALARVKNKLYPAEILEYEHGSKSHGKEGVLESIEHLRRLARIRKIPFEDLTELEKLTQIQKTEAALNFDRANRDQQMLYEILSERGDKEAVLSLVEASKNGAVSRVTQRMVLEKLWVMAERINIRPEDFPVLMAYQNYLGQFAQLDFEKLLGEKTNLEERVYASLLAADDTKRIHALDQYLELLGKAYAIQLSSDEFLTLSASRDDFATKSWMAFLNQKLAELGFFEDLVVYRSHLDDAEEYLREFYALVSKRDEAFIRNAQEAMQTESQNISFLITGGYHTDHLTQLMKQEGISYVVLTPTVETETDLSQYESLLLAHLQTSGGNRPIRMKHTLRKLGLRAGGYAQVVREYGQNPPIFNSHEDRALMEWLEHGFQALTHTDENLEAWVLNRLRDLINESHARYTAALGSLGVTGTRLIPDGASEFTDKPGSVLSGAADICTIAHLVADDGTIGLAHFNPTMPSAPTKEAYIETTLHRLNQSGKTWKKALIVQSRSDNRYLRRLLDEWGFNNVGFKEKWVQRVLSILKDIRLQPEEVEEGLRKHLSGGETMDVRHIRYELGHEDWLIENHRHSKSLLIEVAEDTTRMRYDSYRFNKQDFEVPVTSGDYQTPGARVKRAIDRTWRTLGWMGGAAAILWVVAAHGNAVQTYLFAFAEGLAIRWFIKDASRFKGRYLYQWGILLTGLAIGFALFHVVPAVAVPIDSYSAYLSQGAEALTSFENIVVSLKNEAQTLMGISGIAVLRAVMTFGAVFLSKIYMPNAKEITQTLKKKAFDSFKWGAVSGVLQSYYFLYSVLGVTMLNFPLESGGHWQRAAFQVGFATFFMNMWVAIESSAAFGEDEDVGNKKKSTFRMFLDFYPRNFPFWFAFQSAAWYLVKYLTPVLILWLGPVAAAFPPLGHILPITEVMTYIWIHTFLSFFWTVYFQKKLVNIFDSSDDDPGLIEKEAALAGARAMGKSAIVKAIGKNRPIAVIGPAVSRSEGGEVVQTMRDMGFHDVVFIDSLSQYGALNKKMSLLINLNQSGQNQTLSGRKIVFTGHNDMLESDFEAVNAVEFGEITAETLQGVLSDFIRRADEDPSSRTAHDGAAMEKKPVPKKQPSVKPAKVIWSGQVVVDVLAELPEEVLAMKGVEAAKDTTRYTVTLPNGEARVVWPKQIQGHANREGDGWPRSVLKAKVLKNRNTLLKAKEEGRIQADATTKVSFSAASIVSGIGAESEGDFELELNFGNLGDASTNLDRAVVKSPAGGADGLKIIRESLENYNAAVYEAADSAGARVLGRIRGFIGMLVRTLVNTGHHAAVRLRSMIDAWRHARLNAELLEGLQSDRDETVRETLIDIPHLKNLKIYDAVVRLALDHASSGIRIEAGDALSRHLSFRRKMRLVDKLLAEINKTNLIDKKRRLIMAVDSLIAHSEDNDFLSQTALKLIQIAFAEIFDGTDSTEAKDIRIALMNTLRKMRKGEIRDKLLQTVLLKSVLINPDKWNKDRPQAGNFRLQSHSKRALGDLIRFEVFSPQDIIDIIYPLFERLPLDSKSRLYGVLDLVFLEIGEHQSPAAEEETRRRFMALMRGEGHRSTGGGARLVTRMGASLASQGSRFPRVLEKVRESALRAIAASTLFVTIAAHASALPEGEIPISSRDFPRAVMVHASASHPLQIYGSDIPFDPQRLSQVKNSVFFKLDDTKVPTGDSLTLRDSSRSMNMLFKWLVQSAPTHRKPGLVVIPLQGLVAGPEQDAGDLSLQANLKLIAAVAKAVERHFGARVFVKGSGGLMDEALSQGLIAFDPLVHTGVRTVTLAPREIILKQNLSKEGTYLLIPQVAGHISRIGESILIALGLSSVDDLDDPLLGRMARYIIQIKALSVDESFVRSILYDLSQGLMDEVKLLQAEKVAALPSLVKVKIGEFLKRAQQFAGEILTWA